MAQPMSQLIANYNLARDREQHAFEVSPLGEAVRVCLNGVTGGPDAAYDLWHIGEFTFRGQWAAVWMKGVLLNELIASLAAEVAFNRSMPAFYAGRSLRLW